MLTRRASEGEQTWTIKAEQLHNQADQLAVEAAVWFFEQFGWHDSVRQSTKTIQENLFFPDRSETLKQMRQAARMLIQKKKEAK